MIFMRPHFNSLQSISELSNEVFVLDSHSSLCLESGSYSALPGKVMLRSCCWIKPGLEGAYIQL